MSDSNQTVVYYSYNNEYIYQVCIDEIKGITKISIPGFDEVVPDDSSIARSIKCKNSYTRKACMCKCHHILSKELVKEKCRECFIIKSRPEVNGLSFLLKSNLDVYDKCNCEPRELCDKHKGKEIIRWVVI